MEQRSSGGPRTRVADPQPLRTLVLARDLAVTGRDVRAVRDSRTMARVRRGAYVDAGMWAAANEEERHRMTVLATVAGIRSSALLSHESAAVMLGIPVVGQLPKQVQVMVKRAGGGRSTTWIRRHTVESLPPTTTVDGLTVTSAATTVVDLARTRSFVCGLAAADHVLRTGLADRQDLAAALAAVVGSRGVRRARAVLSRADGRAESVGESVSRGRMYELALPMPQLQREFVDDAGFVGRADFWWDHLRIVGEFDGRVKCRADGHSGNLPPEEVVWREKLREDRLRRQCRSVVRWTWADIMDTARFGRLLANAGVVPLAARRVAP